MVPKKGSDKWRPVIDLSALNKYMVIPSFKMETSELIRSSLQEHEWVTSVDLQDAYFHLPIHPRFRKYFRFRFEGVRYEFWATPFGLGSAPLEFTEHAKETKRILMELGFRINQYLDDWIDRCLSHNEGRISIIKLLHVLLYLGYIPNFDKCELLPSQQFDFVGTAYDLARSRVAPTEKRMNSLYKLTHSFQKAGTKSAREFMSLIGLLNATFLQVNQIGRLHIRPIQWQLARNWRHGDSLYKRIAVPLALNGHLRWWGSKKVLATGTSLHPPKDQVLVFTDASTTGWGAHCEGEDIQGEWDENQVSKHINVLELRTILIAIKLFAQLLRNKVVLILCDNSAAVSHLEKGGGVRSWPLYSLAWLIFAKTSKLGITLNVRHIAGSLNVIADRLSRKGQIMQTEWSLHPQVFECICRQLFKPMVDAFATAENHKLPLYISPVPDPKAYAVDALSFDWSGLSIYMFPPTNLLTKVLRKIQVQPCEVLLIAPFWPAQIWFWDLVHLSTNRPLALPNMKRLLKQPGTTPVFDKNSGVRDLHVWSINSLGTDNPHPIQSDWLKEFLVRKQIPPALYAKQQGFMSSSKQNLYLWLDTADVLM